MESQEGAARAKPGPAAGISSPAALRGSPGPGPGGHPGSPRALPSASWGPGLCEPTRGPEAPRAVGGGRESARGRLATSPSRLPLTRRGSGKRSPWPRRDHPRRLRRRHPRSAADTARRPRPPPPAPLTSSGSSDAGHRKLLGPRLRLSSTPLFG